MEKAQLGAMLSAWEHQPFREKVHFVGKSYPLTHIGMQEPNLAEAEPRINKTSALKGSTPPKLSI